MNVIKDASAVVGLDIFTPISNCVDSATGVKPLNAHNNIYNNSVPLFTAGNYPLYFKSGIDRRNLSFLTVADLQKYWFIHGALNNDTFFGFNYYCDDSLIDNVGNTLQI